MKRSLTILTLLDRHPISTNGTNFDDESVLSNEAIWNSVLPVKPVITGITEQ